MSSQKHVLYKDIFGCHIFIVSHGRRGEDTGVLPYGNGFGV